MKRVPLYSHSVRTRRAGPSPAPERAIADSTVVTPPAAGAGAAPPPATSSRWRRIAQRHDRLLLVLLGALLALLGMFGQRALSPPPARELTQEDINRAVLHTLETQVLPSPAARAYEVIQPSIVAVRGFNPAPKGKGKTKATEPELIESSIGTGVVIVDTGIILTNMHVVAGTKRVMVTFADGLESEAVVTGVRPEHDLAVLQAKTIPDDLVAATMRSTADLALGHEVVAVGYPFGIGPSVSAGVVSGLRREYQSPEGKRLLTNLIQFDAAANPGNSGGPLVTMEGHVVGIVTGILNPTQQRVFVGIGFAVPIENAAAAAGVPPF